MELGATSATVASVAECATAYLFNEDVDSAACLERYHMLNHLYCEIYNYENIKSTTKPPTPAV